MKCGRNAPIDALERRITGEQPQLFIKSRRFKYRFNFLHNLNVIACYGSISMVKTTTPSEAAKSGQGKSERGCEEKNDCS
jgi:hypothetical protein